MTLDAVLHIRQEEQRSDFHRKNRRSVRKTDVKPFSRRYRERRTRPTFTVLPGVDLIKHFWSKFTHSFFVS